MLLAYLAIVYAGCVLGALLELDRRLVLLALQVQGLERRVYRLTRFGDACGSLQRDHTIDPINIFEPASVAKHTSHLMDAFEHASLPKVATVLSSTVQMHGICTRA